MEKKQTPAEPKQHVGLPIHNQSEENSPDGNVFKEQTTWRKVHPTVEHLQGPDEVGYGMEELVVLCLVRDGRPYVRSFVEHYFSMGAKHLVFVDNGSTDDTVEVLKEYDNVTVLRTTLPFNKASAVRRYLTWRFGRGRWSLYVDIDELFDYPYSDVIGLDALLGYLNSNSYTAVVAYMLDMFPEESLSGRSGNVDEPIKELHRFYDLSDLKGKRIKDHASRPPANTYGSDDIMAFSGGIRWIVFGTSTLLTKHPLVFLDGNVRPFVGGPHWHGNVRAADFTGVLFHYKFLDEQLRKNAAQTHRRNHYKRYLEVLEKTPSLSIKNEASKELKSVNDLVGTRLVTVSRQYMRFVESEEQRNGRGSEESRSERLYEAFFNARDEVAALVEEKETMRRKSERLHHKMEKVAEQTEKVAEQTKTLRQENKRLHQKLEKVAEQTKTLRQENKRLRQKVKGLTQQSNTIREENRRLRQKLERVKQQAKSMRVEDKRVLNEEHD